MKLNVVLVLNYSVIKILRGGFLQLVENSEVKVTAMTAIGIIVKNNYKS